MRIIDNCEETNTALRIEWDSLSEAIDDVNQARSARAKSNQGHWRDSEGWYDHDSMCDYKTRREVMALVENPSKDTLDKIDALRAKIEDSAPCFQQPIVRRRRVRNTDWGDDINVDKYLAGRPEEMWSRMDRLPTKSKVITIACEVGVLGGVRRDELLPRGAAVCALADWLISAGYSVEIRAVWCSQDILANGKGNGMQSVLVKAANMPLDTSSIATALCEIAFVRGIMLRGRILHCGKKVSDGLGRTAVLTEKQKEALGLDITAPSNILTETAAVQWLEGAVASLGEAE